MQGAGAGVGLPEARLRLAAAPLLLLLLLLPAWGLPLLCWLPSHPGDLLEAWEAVVAQGRGEMPRVAGAPAQQQEEHAARVPAAAAAEAAVRQTLNQAWAPQIGEAWPGPRPLAAAAVAAAAAAAAEAAQVKVHLLNCRPQKYLR